VLEKFPAALREKHPEIALEMLAAFPDLVRWAAESFEDTAFSNCRRGLPSGSCSSSSP
jgi:hypothetical protein